MGSDQLCYGSCGLCRLLLHVTTAGQPLWCRGQLRRVMLQQLRRLAQRPWRRIQALWLEHWQRGIQNLTHGLCCLECCIHLHHGQGRLCRGWQVQPGKLSSRCSTSAPIHSSAALSHRCPPLLGPRLAVKHAQQRFHQHAHLHSSGAAQAGRWRRAGAGRRSCLTWSGCF